MSPIAIDPDAKCPFVLPEFEETTDPLTGEVKATAKSIPEDKRVTFWVRDLDNAAKLQAQKLIQDKKNPNEFTAFVLSRSLCGWENFCKPDGTPVDFKGNGKDGGAAPEDIARLDPTDEGPRLAIAIFNRAFLKEGDRKN